MPWVLHQKATAVMAGFYAVVATLLIYSMRDTTLLATILVLIFALVLLAGNVYLRGRDVAKGQGAGRKGQGTTGERPKGDPIPAGASVAPRPMRHDPEAGRR